MDPNLFYKPKSHHSGRHKKKWFRKPLKKPPKKILGLLFLLVAIPLVLWYFKPIPKVGIPPDLDYHQEKIAPGVWKLKNRDPVKQVLAERKKVDLNLQENKNAAKDAASGKEVYKWTVKLLSGTVFAFGQQTKDGILPKVKITNKDGLFVRYYPVQNTKYDIQGTERLRNVKPKVKGNVVDWEIAPGITARYTMQQDRVKADYIVDKKENLPSDGLQFIVEHSDKLSSELMPNGEILWLQEAKEIFTFPRPNAIDAKKQSFDGSFKVSESTANRLQLAIFYPNEIIDQAVFPLTIDPQTIDSGAGSGNATAYGNGRKIIRDQWGNLIAFLQGESGAGTDDVWYKNYNSSTWTDAGIGSNTGPRTEHAADIDSSGNIHFMYTYNTDAFMYYNKLNITRNATNTITSISQGFLEMDSATTQSVGRPSLFIANKGMGAGKEKVTVIWASNSISSTIRGELRFMQCDVADNCLTAANWKNASESETGNGTCTDGTVGLPSGSVCTGAADPIFRYTTAHTIHHGVITQLPQTPRRNPESAKFFDGGGSTYTDLTNALDASGSTDTGSTLNSMASNDYIYIGDGKKFSKVSIDIENTNSTVNTLVMEYCSANSDTNTTCDTWSSVSNQVNNSLFTEDGSELFDEPSSWIISTENGSQKYWVRMRPSTGFDSTTSVDEFYINDRNSGALVVVGGPAAQDLRTAFVPWDDIADDKWENHPSSSSNAWREMAGGSGDRLAANGSSWTQTTNYPLAATVDYQNNSVYIAYHVCSGTACATSSSLRVEYINAVTSITTPSNWISTGFPDLTEATDVTFSLTADQGDIYFFYVLDHDATGLVYRKCSGTGSTPQCSAGAEWGSEQTLVQFTSTSSEPTHPQAIMSKAFGDTIAIDLIYTNNITTPAVAYERHYITSTDSSTTITATADDAYHNECQTTTHDQSVGSGSNLLGGVGGNGQCDPADNARSHVGMRFPNIQIPQGATIASAYLDYSVHSISSLSTIEFSIYGEDTNDAPAFGTITNCTPSSNCIDGSGNSIIAERTRTSNSTSHSIFFQAGVRYRFDVTDIVQEIICRGASASQPCVGNNNGSGSWASGNDLALLLISTESYATNYAAIIAAEGTTGLKPSLHINLGSSGKNYSMGASSQLATGSGTLAVSDLDHPLSSGQMGAVNTDDDVYASVAATPNFASQSAAPAFMFKINNSNNATDYNLDAIAKVKTSIPTSRKPVYLQVYRGGSTDNWVTVAMNNNTASDTEFTLDPGAISSLTSEYYFNDTPGIGTQYAECTTGTANCWSYWRIYQDLDTSSTGQILSVDYFNLTHMQITPTKVVFTNSTRSFQHSACSGTAQPFTIQLQNAASVAVPPTQSTVVRVTSNSPGETIYSDDTCQTSVTNGDFTFTTAQTDKTFYVRDTSVSNPTWTLTASGQSGNTLTDGTQTYTVLGATQVVFTNNQRSFGVNECSGAANVFTIQLRDSTGTAITPTASTVIRITSNSSSYTIYTDDTCSTQATNGDITFTTSDSAKNFYIVDLVRSTPSWTLTAAKQSGPETITSGQQEYSTTAISSQIRGGTRIRGGTTLR
jgi:hypothetical protein